MDHLLSSAELDASWAEGKMSEFQGEVSRGERFEFGRNWRRFLSVIDDDRIAEAERALSAMLGTTDLRGKRFLDIGSGSGLHSLAARRLGARVHSFDYDPESTRCTADLAQRYCPGDPDWVVEVGSVLDLRYMCALGSFDIVYCWGVLHHTGAMWSALENTCSVVHPGGRLCLAVYNRQRFLTPYWTRIKSLYAGHPALRLLIVASHAPYLLGARLAVRVATGRLTLRRGMSFWHDFVDWLGGFPFETAKPEEVLEHCRIWGFALVGLKTCGGASGCNEFVFVRKVPA